MTNDRLISISALIFGVFMFGASISFASDDDANFKPFSEPETAGIVAGNDNKDRGANPDYGKSEADVGSKVERTLKEKEQLADVQAIETGDGIVSLIGSVEDEEQKQKAEKTASDIEGVNEVDNRLMVQN